MDPRAGDALAQADHEARPDEATDADEAVNAELEATRSQIEETRAQLGDTINAIQEKLSPQHLIEQAKETVHEATIGKAQQVMNNAVDSAREAVSSAVDSARDTVGSVTGHARATGYSMWDTIERNPVPAAMIALGLGWLYMSTRRDHERDHWRYTTRRDDWNRATPREHPGYRAAGVPGDTGTTEHMPAGATRPGHGETSFGSHEGVVDRARDAASGAVEATGEAMTRAGRRARDVGGNVWDRIEENPLPAAAMAISLGWLLMSGRRQETRRYYGDRDRGEYWPGYQGESRAGTRYAGQSTHDRGMVDTVRERAGDVADTVRERAGDVAENVRETTGQVVDRVQDRYERVATGTRYQADRISDEFQTLMRDNPLAAGAAAFAIGAAIGMAVPASRRERELMGEARDRLVDRAQDAMQEVAGRVRSVAGEAVDSVKEAAGREGLMPESGGTGSMGSTTAGTGTMGATTAGPGGSIGNPSTGIGSAMGMTTESTVPETAILADDTEDEDTGTGGSVVPGYDRSRGTG